MREKVCGIALGILLAVLVVVSLGMGTYDLAASDIPSILFAAVTGTPVDAEQKATTVLLVIRIPRILIAALAGAALAVSGAAYQGIFKNPMVSPDILGVSSGAGAGAALALILGLPSVMVHGVSFAFGVAAVLTVMTLARAFGKSGNALVVMILAGTVISSLFTAVTSLLKYVADPDDTLPLITYWLMGSFARSGNDTNMGLMTICLMVGAGVLVALRWRINVMSFGDEEARSMGVNVRASRAAIILASTLLTSVTVCMCGSVGWVGLIIPHAIRLVTGPNYKSLIPLSMLGGACFTLLVDDVARLIVPGELPVSVLTALIGAPLFIYLLAKGRKEWL
ncbi:MAG: iron ABC transporter permease [Eggerthellaceae bacterium]|nr:iron ABC transporter permease [Eggerthellaceae bacterium]